MKIIDAHAHLWLKQDTIVEGQEIRTLEQGRSMFFGEVRQMLPPFMIDGRNTAEVFLSNMDYAQVSAAVITQEFIDGLQNEYLAEVEARYPDRFFVNGMCDYRLPGYCEEAERLLDRGFRGLAIPAHRLTGVRLDCPEMMRMMHLLEEREAILSICLAPDEEQPRQMKKIIAECPRLKVAIGHFGMVTTPHWLKQIELAEAENVMIESGGITWLFNSEFYPYPTAIAAIKEAAAMVGIEKLMWGSDYPRTITAITYRMSYDFVTKSSELDEREKRLFLGENAQKFYGFKDLVELPYIKNMSE